MGSSSPRSLLRTALLGLAAAAAMFAFGYAMVPLYYKFCAALGIDVANPLVLADARQQLPSRSLRVEFDANVHNDLIAMRPAQRIASMDTGIAYSLTYEIVNLTDETLHGQAVPSYSPARAARWFNKLQCFCFERLTLAPGETLREPVVFVLGRDLPEDIEVVALSYTFYADDSSDAGHASH